MRFRVLGPLEVEGGDGPVPLAGRRLRALLTALLVQPGEAVSTQRLVDAVWEDDPPETPANALQQVVTRLRARLGPGASSLVTVPHGYRLDVSPDAVDALEFEAAYRGARALMQSDPAAAARELEPALALWRGPAYGEFASGFAQAPSVRLEEMRTSAREDHVELLLRTGQHGDAVAEASELVGTAPLRERPVEQLMRALHASGRVADALEAYRAHRQLLADELGLDPPAGLRELEARLLRDDVPAPRTAAAQRTSVTPRASLPWRAGRIIGRDEDLAIVRRCLNERPLVTLVGPGGVGKTRLALEVAHDLAGEGGSVAWVDLSTLETGRVADAVAEAVGVDMPRGQDPSAALGASLRALSAVLFLDNAETALDEVAPLVEGLVEQAPRLRVLATSRERLAVHSEHVHRLAPLPLPSGAERDNPAVRLFLERAGGLESPTDEQVSDIAVLCRRLDGLPLAIELGAAHAQTFGIREFSEHVASELDLLAGGRRTAATRHRTLRAVVDASYSLLTADEARLFDRLGVFPSVFTLDDVRSICSDPPLAARLVGSLLARLADQSLVQTDAGRFWLLETLRTYAIERLTQEEFVSLRERHAQWVAAQVAQLTWQLEPDREVACVARLSELGADLRAAWAYAVNHDRPFGVQLAAVIYDFAYGRQRLDLLDWGLQVAQWDIDHPDLSSALGAGAAGAWAAGDLVAAGRLAQRGMSSDDAAGRPRSPSAVSQAANLAMFAGDFDDAIELYRECIDVSLAAGHTFLALLEEIAICQVMSYAGRRTEALHALVDLTRRARAVRSPSAIAWAAFVTGEAVGDTDVTAALAAYSTAVEESLKVDNRLFLGLARSSAVALRARHGSIEEALAEFGRVVDEWDELGNVTAQWWVLMNLSVLFARAGADRPAALIAGAIAGAESRTYTLLGDEERLRDTVRQLADRLGESTVAALMDEGGGLTIDEGVALAKKTLERLADPVQPTQGSASAGAARSTATT